MSQQSFNSDGGFSTVGNVVAGNVLVTTSIGVTESASPAPTISGFGIINSVDFSATGNVTAGNILLNGGYINGGTATVVTDGINSIQLAPGAQMDVFAFPFSAGTARGQLTITGNITTTQALGTWYYQSVNSYTYQLYTDNTYSALVDASGWTAYTGGGSVAIALQSPPANVVINSNGYLSTFSNVGSLTLPGGLNSATNLTITANTQSWTFDTTGNLTVPGSIIMPPNSVLIGQSASPAPRITGFDSISAINFNASGNISATGNITSSNIRGLNLNLDGSGQIHWDYGSYIIENGASHALSVVGGTALALTTPGNLTLVSGNNTATFDYTTGNLSLPSAVSAVGNITGGNATITTLINTTSVSASGNIRTAGTVSATGNITGGNVLTGGIMSSTGNATHGNILTGGQISATGTITSGAGNNATAFAVGNGAVSNCALSMTPTAGTPGNYAIRDYSTANSVMFFDTTIGSANTGGSFQFRSSNAFTQLAVINTYGVSTPTTPAFRVYGNGVTTGLNVTTNGTGILNGNNWAVDYNQGSYLNSTTGVFTAPVAGLYQVNLVARCANNSAPSSQAIVYKNYGSANTVQVMWEVAASTTVNHFGVSTVSKLAVGDTLTLKATVGNVTFDVNDSYAVAFLG